MARLLSIINMFVQNHIVNSECIIEGRTQGTGSEMESVADVDTLPFSIHQCDWSLRTNSAAVP